MAIRWKIPFKSLRNNTSYTVNVYDSSFSGTPIQLIGAAQPFTTEEDISDDWFIPVRTQSGYLRIVDNGKDANGNNFSWKNLIPDTDKSRKVTLTDGSNNVVWQGYLQPQTYGSRLFEDVQVREFPVFCPLSVLAGIDTVTTEFGMINFAFILEHLLTETGVSFSAINFQGSDAINWLQKTVEWDNLIDIDSELVRSSKYDLLTVLQEFCKFFGWTCRTFKDEIYFVSPDDNLYPDFISINMQDLSWLASGISVQYSTFQWNNVDTDDEIYATTNNSIEILRGLRKVKITADINKLNNILSVDFGDIERALKEEGTVTTIVQGDTEYYRIDGLSDGYESANYSIELHWDQSDIRASFFLSDSCPVADVPYKHVYNWQCWLLANDGPLTSGSYAARFTCKRQVALENGIIVFSGSTNSASNGWIIARLKIGDLYYDGSSWDSNSSNVFNIPFGVEQGTFPQSGDGRIISNRQLNEQYPDYDGFSVPISVATGELQFDIVSVYTTQEQGHRAVRISDFDIEFYRHNNYAFNTKDENVYQQETGSVFTEDREITTIFASDNGNSMGLGIIHEPTGYYCQDLPYSYLNDLNYEKPEEHLLARMVNRGTSTKMKETIEVVKDLVTFNPHTMAETGNMTAYPVSISHNWRDDIENIKLLEF